MLQIQIDLNNQSPLYEQIADQVKMMIENGVLHSGDKIPTVRELSQQMHINPTTVARAYRILEQESLVEARARRGTIVRSTAANSTGMSPRERRLLDRINSFIINALSMGYSPDELESILKARIEECPAAAESLKPAAETLSDNQRNTVNIIGSNDLALDLLVSRLRYQSPGWKCLVTPAGSMGGLLAILEGKADMAGTHLLDETTGAYNRPYIEHTLQGIPVAVVHLANRIQGLMVAKNNPKAIHDLSDLCRSDITFTNRQKGSGTRVLLDFKLRELGIQAQDIKGYQVEMNTHLEVAMSIVNGNSDVGLGITSAANSCNLDFIPTTKEQFDLIIPISPQHDQLLETVLEILRSDDFKRTVDEMGGYDTSRTGEMVVIK
jgi:molybdate-binding protein/DNA-binding transcriptional regulator YhcF (GntR family)